MTQDDDTLSKRADQRDENVIFNEVTPQWKEFCTGELEFRVPDDLDLIQTDVEPGSG